MLGTENMVTVYYTEIMVNVKSQKVSRRDQKT